MNLFDPEILARLGNLQLRAQQLADGMMLGEHASLRKGVSTEFIDHQRWEKGDNPKFIDWRVYARTGKLFRRRFAEDTDMPVYLMVDKSAEMGYRGHSAALSKSAYADCLAATLGFLAVRQRDRLALTLFNATRIFHQRLASGEAHWRECLQTLESPPLDTSRQEIRTFAEGLAHFAVEFPQRGSLFLLSDFLSAESFETLRPMLKQLVAQRHEITLVQLADPDEITFPFESYCDFVSLVQAQDHIRTDASHLREAYLARRQQWQQQYAAGCHKLGIHFVSVSTDTPLDVTLKEIC